MDSRGTRRFPERHQRRRTPDDPANHARAATETLRRRQHWCRGDLRNSRARQPEPASGGIRAQIAIPGRSHHLPWQRASQRGFRSSVWGSADTHRRRSFRECSVPTASAATRPSPRSSPGRKMVCENSRPRKQISLRPLPTPDADHTAPRHDGWTLRHAGHYPELEYHRRDREEPRSGELMSVPRLQHVSKPKCLCCASSAAPKSTGPSMPPPNPADAIRAALGNAERVTKNSQVGNSC